MLGVIIQGETITQEMWLKIRFTFETSNTGLTKIIYNERGWYIKTWNDQEHLGEVR